MDLPHNILLYVLLLVAVGAGFLMGRKDRPAKRPQTAVIKDYYQGLNFLLGDRPELGVDRFIEAMEVSDATIDVHLAMAGVVRRRGELDKAIRIHQNLLASPVLSNANKQLVEMELARDYHAGGLWDRAEKLDLYEQEREWQRAIDVSAKLVKSSADIRVRVCHFYCELAELALAENDRRRAANLARKATDLGPGEARGYWVLARLALLQGQHRKVLKLIQKATELAPELVAAYLETYRKACEALTNDGEYERFLRQSLQLYPDAALLRELIDLRGSNGNAIAAEEVVEEIARAPSFAHLPLLMELGQRQPDLMNVRTQVSTIIQNQAAYQCANCGFNSPKVLWHCPGCRAWGSFGAAGRFKSAASH